MAFPLTHLLVAKKIIDKLQDNIVSKELFVLGSIAPDAVHYRKEFVGAAMSGIGAAKKITHLCPVSDEKWGQVTDNDGWVECIKTFLASVSGHAASLRFSMHAPSSSVHLLRKRRLRRPAFLPVRTGSAENHCANALRGLSNRSLLTTQHGHSPLETMSFALGYAVHALTDIANNQSLWRTFITNHPEEAAKGYTSDYYKDLRSIDTRLYNEFFRDGEIFKLLRDATPQSIPDLVDASELLAIQDNLLNVAYFNVSADSDTSGCVYVTYQQVLDFIDYAAEFCIRHISEFI